MWLTPRPPNRPSAPIYSPRSLLARTRISTRAAAVRHCCRPVSTVPQSFSPRTREPQPFPVNHNTSPSHVLIKRSHPFTGVRASATAAGPPPSSSLLRRFSKLRGLPGTFPGSHGSLLCSTWLSPGHYLTAVELPTGAPPLLRRRRSPEFSLADPPPPIGSWWAQSTIPLACLRGRALPRRRRAHLRRRARGGWTEGIIAKISKVLRSPAQKDSSQFCVWVQHLVKSIKNGRKIQK
jgi:hypothetical protein